MTKPAKAKPAFKKAVTEDLNDPVQSYLAKLGQQMQASADRAAGSKQGVANKKPPAPQQR